MTQPPHPRPWWAYAILLALAFAVGPVWHYLRPQDQISNLILVTSGLVICVWAAAIDEWHRRRGTLRR
jgi:hypothetical protein